MEVEVDLDLKSLDLKEKRRRLTEKDDLGEGDQTTSDLELDDDFRKNPRRSGRKRMRPVDYSVAEQQRAVTTPAPRRLPSFDASAKDIKNYYLDKRVKLVHQSLETIYEEPNKVTMSTKKLKRSINFFDINSTTIKNQVKIKKRAMKAKKVHPFKKLGKKVGLKLLMEKLSSLEESEDVQMTVN